METQTWFIGRDFITKLGEKNLCYAFNFMYGWVIARHSDGVVIAKGKELEKYEKDTIRIMRDGYTKWKDADFYLVSDRHGIIHTWKGEKK